MHPHVPESLLVMDQPGRLLSASSLPSVDEPESGAVCVGEGGATVRPDARVETTTGAREHTEPAG